MLIINKYKKFAVEITQLPPCVFLTLKVTVAIDLYFINNEGLEFQLKISFSVQLKKATYISEVINSSFSFISECNLTLFIMSLS